MSPLGCSVSEDGTTGGRVSMSAACRPQAAGTGKPLTARERPTGLHSRASIAGLLSPSGSKPDLRRMPATVVILPVGDQRRRRCLPASVLQTGSGHRHGSRTTHASQSVTLSPCVRRCPKSVTLAAQQHAPNAPPLCTHQKMSPSGLITQLPPGQPMSGYCADGLASLQPGHQQAWSSTSASTAWLL